MSLQDGVQWLPIVPHSSYTIIIVPLKLCLLIASKPPFSSHYSPAFSPVFNLIVSSNTYQHHQNPQIDSSI
ncbi:hypothetical protein L2E82_37058 [Cichorium intybus]|uniref:Uncharacterized protein n=1 Tax=Cichorium intybus TaxID=13427 RepID=A0ACB9ACW3_CICIN|nr:hypothetical protein L2E82_37058 [Cichorium intybus]